MTTILDEMGPVHDDSGPAGSPGATAADAAEPGERSTSAGTSGTNADSSPGTTTKRLYRMLDTGFIGGVCSGIATFLDVDVTLVRIAVALLGLLEVVFVHSPITALAYIAAMFIVPAADTSEERAAARGIPFNAQQLIDEAKRNFSRIGEHDWKDTRRAWRKNQRWERRYARRMRRSFTWPPPASGPYRSQVAAGFMTPVFTIISVGAFWFMLFAALSLAQTRSVYHWSMPAGIPLWLALLVLFLIYQAVVAPLRFWRHASYYRLGGLDHGRYQALDGMMSAILSLAIVWTAYHYSPELREWLRHLPDAWHNVVASFKSSGVV